MKQHAIDKGQIGGLISVFSNSLVILSPFSFIGILTLNYDRFIKYWIDLPTFIIIAIIGFILYEFLFYTIVFPSIMQFSNRQMYVHENPLLNEIHEIKATLKRLEEKQ